MKCIKACVFFRSTLSHAIYTGMAAKKSLLPIPKWVIWLYMDVFYYPADKVEKPGTDLSRAPDIEYFSGRNEKIRIKNREFHNRIPIFVKV